MVEDKINDQAHYVIDSAVAIYQFPNSRDSFEAWCNLLAKSVNTVHPTYFITTEQPYVIGQALIYVLSRGLWKDDNAIVTTYYLLLKSARNKSYPLECVIVASMLVFAFLDEHKEVIGKKVIENNLQPTHNINEIIIYQIIVQLCVLFWSFDKLNYDDYISDYWLVSWVEKAVAKYRDKFSETNEVKKQNTIDFVNENTDIMLKNIEIYWEDLSEKEYL